MWDPAKSLDPDNQYKSESIVISYFKRDILKSGGCPLKSAVGGLSLGFK
jgi:hypothetical protein